MKINKLLSTLRFNDHDLVTFSEYLELISKNNYFYY